MDVDDIILVTGRQLDPETTKRITNLSHTIAKAFGLKRSSRISPYPGALGVLYGDHKVKKGEQYPQLIVYQNGVKIAGYTFIVRITMGLHGWMWRQVGLIDHDDREKLEEIAGRSPDMWRALCEDEEQRMRFPHRSRNGIPGLRVKKTRRVSPEKDVADVPDITTFWIGENHGR